ncbi:MAG: hypothetical protein ACKV2V_03345 [Blastocatellia bacterium]
MRIADHNHTPRAANRLPEIAAIAHATDSLCRGWQRLSHLAGLQPRGPFAAMVWPATISGAARLTQRLEQAGFRWRVAGHGPSVMIPMATAETPAPVVISLRLLRETPRITGAYLHAHAGSHLRTLIDIAAASGLSGLECFAGLEGGLGGLLQPCAAPETTVFRKLVENITIAHRGDPVVIDSGDALFRKLFSPASPPEEETEMLVLAATLRLRTADAGKVRRETERWRRARRLGVEPGFKTTAHVSEEVCDLAV